MKPTAYKNPKIRLDILLLESGLADSREAAKRRIMAGEVRVGDHVITKPGALVATDAPITLKAKPRFVSRGGEKLAAALQAFAIKPDGWVCADVGASTGGFTDCLLKAGAARVYAIDVGYGQLDWAIRQDSRVVVMERVNARYLKSLSESVDFTCIDVSFISLKLIVPAARLWLHPGGEIVALVKPQFEAGKTQVGKGGVVRDPGVHRQVLQSILSFSVSEGFSILGLIPSPLRGPSGNIEFLLWLGQRVGAASIEADKLVESALDAASSVR